jgi:hypothetical protein
VVGRDVVGASDGAVGWVVFKDFELGSVALLAGKSEGTLI